MYKAGDKFEIVRSSFIGDCWQPGKVVTLTRDFNGESVEDFYSDQEGYSLGFAVEGKQFYPCTVRPLRTEAEKRGAKFGVTGFVKRTKRKISFVSDSLKKNDLGEIVWCVCYEDGETDYYHPSNIRLDHEPEYKEIPFSEATHEQRMDAGNLWYGGSPAVQINYFAGSGYAFTYKGSFDIRTDTNNLTIRIPT